MRCGKDLRPNFTRCVLHGSAYALFARVSGGEMKRTSVLKAAVVLFLLTILLGGSAEVSIVATEILFVVVIVIIAGIVVFSIIGSKFNKKRKAHR
jgi:hypothetical protein